MLSRLTATDLRDFDAASAKEWLETDGCGGYAASTVLACPTRRYHGWLVAPAGAQGKRHVFLTRCDEWLVTAGGEHPFSCAIWPGVVAPRGDRLQVGFAMAPHPTFTYEVDGLTLRREILMSRGQHAVLVRYSLVGGGAAGVELWLRPLLAVREADALTLANPDLDARLERLTDGVRCRPYAELPAVAMTWSAGSAELDGPAAWYREARYPADAARGYDGSEDNWSPCRVRLPLRAGAPVVFAAALDRPLEDPAGVFAAEEGRRRTAAASVRSARDRVALSADAFLYRTSAGRPTVCAGYPWFTEWGRDTFIALPGLTLARGQVEACGEVLSGAVPFLRRGLLPNIYGPTPEQSAYNSVDASLWFARAVWAWADAGGPRARLLQEFAPALTEIAECYADGSAGLGIGLADGLLRAGGPDLNPTWMDARTPDGPVTPRDGCAVELNALWYQLLVNLADVCLAKKDKAAAKRYADMAKKHQRAFLAAFWLEKEGYLADRVHDGVVDKSVRPNMVLAAALRDSPLANAQRRAVVTKARAELLTPRGLRTLSPQDHAYVGRYAGGPLERDAAYHQGTAWPWLLGFYVEASLRAHGDNRQVCVELRELWRAFAPELDGSGLEHVSEVFDGDLPQRPGGTFAQAWNTGEWLRSWRLLDEAEGVRA
ncbi:MAG: amylo-alpha-1,6-glucosidase [Planctomycetota bacterium]